MHVVDSVVAFCIRRPWPVVIASLILTALALYVTVTRFAINTDTARLISPTVEWRKNEIAFDKAFPQQADLIVAVIDGRSPEVADEAAEKLEAALRPQTGLFRTVRRPDAGPFFAKNGLLFLPPEDLAKTVEQ